MRSKDADPTHANAALVRGLWLAAAAGDAEALCVQMTDDVVWRSYGNNAVAGEFHGRDKVIAHLAEFADLVDDCRLDLLEVESSEQGASIRYRLRAKRGLMTVDTTVRIAFEIVDGRVARGTATPEEPEATDRFLGWSH